MLKIVIVVVLLGGVAVWGYFMFGPWWDQVNVKTVTDLIYPTTTTTSTTTTIKPLLLL
jgi:hypothetical protein